MPKSKEERDRILQMIESGQITAVEASQLLDAIAAEQDTFSDRTVERGSNRIMRIRVTSMNAKSQKIYMTATIPVRLIKASVRLGLRFVPQLNNAALTDLIHTIEGGATGRILDMQDLEKGERLEVFVEER